MRRFAAPVIAAIIALSAVAAVAQGNRVTVSIPTGDEILASCAGGIVYVTPEGAARVVGCSNPATATATVPPTASMTPGPTVTPSVTQTPSITPTPGGVQSASLPVIVTGGMRAENPSTVIRNESFVPTGRFSGPQTNRALLQFDTTSISTDATVTAAALRLNVDTNFTTDAHTVYVYRTGRRWIGGVNPAASWDRYRHGLTLPWSTPGAAGPPLDRDAAPIGSVDVTSATAGQVTISLDVAAIQELISGARPDNGLLLVAGDEAGTTLMRWKGITQELRPRLLIDYTVPPTTLLDGLAAYWPMDGGDYSDATACGRDLTPHNAPATVAGKIGDAVGFTAATGQWLSSADAALKPGDTDWTWAGWVNLTDKADYYTVAAQRGNDERGWLLWYHKQTVLDYYVFQINDDGSTGNGDPYICDTIGFNGGNPPEDEWVFLAARHDSVRGFGHLFVNGTAPSSSGSHFAGEYGASDYYSPYPGSPLPSAADFTIGRVDSTSNRRYMNGAVDEAGFWNRWLSNAEIAALYNGGAGLAYPFGLTPGGCP